MISKKCKQHLKEVDESAFKHMWQALKIAIRLQILIPAIIIHAFIPRLFTHTGTDVMKSIIERRKK